MSTTAYKKTALTGGGASALDGIDGSGLLDGDFAFVTLSNNLYFYILDDDSAAAESSPNIISPDANAGNKRWIRQQYYPYNAAKPAFLAKAALQADVTGDGTAYTIVFGTEIFDQNADFDGVSTFTAPVTGKYFLYSALYLAHMAAGHTTTIVTIKTSNRDHPNYYIPVSGTVIPGESIFVLSALADMDVGDTAYITFTVSGAAKAVDVQATYSVFGGFLVC